MEACSNIKSKDYNSFIRIIEEYLPGNSENQIRKMYKKHKNTFVGYYLDETLIGICYGWPRKEEAVKEHSFSIAGIAIIHPYNAQGRGAKLITYFEQKVIEMGYDTISVGSADGYVEKFYLKNGYIPTEYKVLREGKETYVHPISSFKDYQDLNKDEVIRKVGGYHGFIVFYKKCCQKHS